MNRDQLKFTACLSMLIDHIGIVFLEPNSCSYFLFRGVGRLACPIFLWLLVDGFRRTKTPLIHIRNLLILGLATEPIYDKVLHNTWFYWKSQNILLTWTFCYLMIFLLSKIEKSKDKYVYASMIIFSFSVVACLLRLDYIFMATISAALCYYFQESSNLLAPIPFMIDSPLTICSVPIISSYKPRIGEKSKLKSFFYLFYPLHLVVLYLVKIV